MRGAFHPPRRRINFASFLLILSVLWNVTMLVGFMSWPSLRPDELIQDNNLVSGLGSGFSRAPQSLSGTVNLAFVIPYMDADIDRLVEAMGAWSEVGHACSSLHGSKVGLYFYNNLVDKPGKRRMEPLIENITRASSLMTAVMGCFTVVQTVYADLKPEDDDYPEGPSVMFFNLMLQKRLRDDALAGYTHVMWMEMDLRPVRPFWIDAIFDAATHENADFWVRGSYYYGKGLDSAIKPHNHDWVGHINGNALYALRDPEFHMFLLLAREREPPTDYWRAFDITMWRVLHDFSYSWRVYQTYRHKFQHAAFVRSVECVTSTDRHLLIGDSYLAHESVPHEKKGHYLRKFSEESGLPLTQKTLYGDEIRPHLQLSVFLPMPGRENFESASLVLILAQKYIPHALEYVVVVSEDEGDDANAAFPHFVKIHTVSRNIHANNLQQSFMSLRADEFCRGRHILHLDVDVAISRTVYYKDLFLLEKPILEYTLYDKSDGLLAQGGRNVANHLFGRAPAREYSKASSRHVYSREIYVKARQHLQDRLQTSSFQTALQALEKLTINAWFDGLDFLGIFLEFILPEYASFVHRGPTFDNSNDERAKMSAFMYPYRELSVPSPFCALDRHLQQKEDIPYGMQKQKRLSILKGMGVGATFVCA
jgi:hypothetical protein